MVEIPPAKAGKNSQLRNREMLKNTKLMSTDAEAFSDKFVDFLKSGNNKQSHLTGNAFHNIDNI